MTYKHIYKNFSVPLSEVKRMYRDVEYRIKNGLIDDRRTQVQHEITLKRIAYLEEWILKMHPCTHDIEEFYLE